MTALGQAIAGAIQERGPPAAHPRPSPAGEPPARNRPLFSSLHLAEQLLFRLQRERSRTSAPIRPPRWPSTGTPGSSLFLLLVRYPDAARAEAAAGQFVEKILGGADEGMRQMEGGRWAGLQLPGEPRQRRSQRPGRGRRSAISWPGSRNEREAVMTIQTIRSPAGEFIKSASAAAIAAPLLLSGAGGDGPVDGRKKPGRPAPGPQRPRRERAAPPGGRPGDARHRPQDPDRQARSAERLEDDHQARRHRRHQEQPLGLPPDDAPGRRTRSRSGSSRPASRKATSASTTSASCRTRSS